MSQVTTVVEEEEEEEEEIEEVDLEDMEIEDDEEEIEVDLEEVEEEEVEEEEVEEVDLEEVEEEVEEEEEEVAPKKKGKKKGKKRGPPKKRRPPSDRHQKIPNYNTHLRRTRKAPVEGEEPKKRAKLRSGTKAGRESRYLQEVATSGTFFAAQPVRRVIKDTLTECAQELQVASLEWEELNEATGKKFANPLKKGVDKWCISSDAVQKIVAGAQRYVDQLAGMSHDIHVARKSVTVIDGDVELAHKFITML